MDDEFEEYSGKPHQVIEGLQLLAQEWARDFWENGTLHDITLLNDAIKLLGGEPVDWQTPADWLAIPEDARSKDGDEVPF